MDLSEFEERLSRLVADSPHGLVSAGERDLVRSRHLPEAQAVAEWLGRPTGRWMDLGTGGGLPGLVLARAHPQVEWVLVDARGKKAQEVERFATQLGVACEVVCGRAEELARDPRWRERFDGVVARAVAPLRTLVEIARGFLGSGGRLVAVKGERARQEVEEAQGALDRMSMLVDRLEPLGWGETVMVEVRALGPVPDEVPRRPGVPQRRPW